MAGVTSFIDLKCWKEARILSRSIFRDTVAGKYQRDRRLVEQINDSSESVMSNIAEGFGRGTQEEFITFLGYALGSLDETRSHLCAAFDREYYTKDEFAERWTAATTLRKMIVALIGSMFHYQGGVRHLRKQENWSSKVWEIYERTTGRKRPPMFEHTREPESNRPQYRDDMPE